MKIAELLQRIVSELEISCNKLFRVVTDNGSEMVATFKANNNNEDDIADFDTDSVTLEESEELFPDQDDLDKVASSEVDYFHICQKDH